MQELVLHNMLPSQKSTLATILTRELSFSFLADFDFQRWRMCVCEGGEGGAPGCFRKGVG